MARREPDRRRRRRSAAGSESRVRYACLEWHGDTFDLPAGAVRLAETSAYPNQAFRVGAAAWGLQFHVEIDEETIEAFLAASPAEAERVARRRGSDARAIPGPGCPASVRFNRSSAPASPSSLANHVP